jgi:hypothetical protein
VGARLNTVYVAPQHHDLCNALMTSGEESSRFGRFDRTIGAPLSRKVK